MFFFVILLGSFSGSGGQGLPTLRRLEAGPVTFDDVCLGRKQFQRHTPGNLTLDIFLFKQSVDLQMVISPW